MTFLLIIIGISLLVFNIWNLISLNSLKKNSSKKDKQLNDAKYYELKYKSEFIVAVFSIIVAVAGLLGYNTLNSAKDEIKFDLLKKTKSIDSIINITEKRIKLKDSLLHNIELKQNIINSKIPVNEEKVNAQNYQIYQIQKVISDLNKNNKIKQSFYLVRDLSLEINKDYYNTYRFEDLKTNIGDRLPKFVNKPFIIIIPESTTHLANIRTDNVTVDKFSATIVGGYTSLNNSDDEPDKFKFSIMIIESK
ncbi:hypothetical protein H3Z83_09510 [Tenacibaculum sp. S7007]|uniref:Uncharacterized protein n=1 Tax=Tenacibaculum pelagium TaxID=2759527 RepID=A0A839AQU4_9FLAO|nr:hypothetical protein [Tenacibaculum pelagium]MBA6156750.1 hypothetical protein [Tenacibaculum pelagium]